MDLSKLTAAVAETEKEFRRLMEDNLNLQRRLLTISSAIEQPLARIVHVDNGRIEREPQKAPVVSPRVAKGKRGRKPKISDADVQAIKRGRQLGITVLALAKKYKATPPTIYAALKRAAANGSGAGKH